MKKYFYLLVVILSGLLFNGCTSTMEPAYRDGYHHHVFPGESIKSSTSGSDLNVLWNRAESLEREGKIAEAADLYYKIAISYPDSDMAPRGLYRVGKIMAQSGRFKEAETYYIYLLNHYPRWENKGSVYGELAEVFILDRNPQEAIRISGGIEEPLRKDLMLSVAYWQLGDSRRSLKYLEDFASSRRLENPANIINAVEFMSKTLEVQHFNTMLVQRSLSPSARLILQAGLGKKLIDVGNRKEGEALIAETIREAGNRPFFVEALTQLSGKRRPCDNPATCPSPAASNNVEPLNIITAEPGDPKKIALLVPITGTFGSYGYQIVRGANIARSIWNENHPQDQIDLIIQDTPNDPEAVVKAFKKVVEQDKVVAVIGPMSRNGLEAILEGANQLPLLTVALVPESRSDLSGQTYGTEPFHIRFLPDVVSMVDKLGDYCISTLGHKTYGVLYPDEPFGKQALEAFKKSIESKGGSVIAEVSYHSKTTNFQPYIEKLVNGDSKNTVGKPPFQALFLPDEIKTVSLIAPQLLYYNVVGVNLLGTHLWENPKLESLSGGYLDGAYYVTPYFHKEEGREFDVFKTRFKEAYKGTPQFLEAAGYDATTMLLKIRDRASSKNRAELMRAATGFSFNGSITGVKKILPTGLLDRSYMIINIKGSDPVKAAN